MKTIITNIKKDKNFYTISINNKSYTIDNYYYECLLPYNDKEIDNNTLKEIKAFSLAHESLKRIYNKLFLNEISTYELKVYLSKKEIDSDSIDIIISFLKNEGHLKEENLINHFKEHFEANKGIKAFEAFLASKKISRNSIEKALNEYNENYEYALSYANSLIKSKTNSNEMLKYKIKTNLLNKGFSYSAIDYALENVTFNEEQINLKKDLEKVLKKYPNDCYKVISKLAIKGYNVNEIKKALKEEGVFDED